jgi:hypothetical protein
VSGVDGGLGVVGQDPVVIVAEAVAIGGVTVEVEATGTESGPALCFTEQGLTTEAEGVGIDGVVLSGCGEDEPEVRYLMGERCGEEHAREKFADTMGLRGGEAEAEVGRVVGQVTDGDVEREEEAEEGELEVAWDAVGVEEVCGCGVETAVDEVAVGGDGDGVAGQAHAAAEV